MTPTELDFGETFAGLPVTRTLTLLSPSRASRRVSVLTPTDFSAPASLELRGGELGVLNVRFDATDIGPRSAVLELRDEAREETIEIVLSAHAKPVPDCGAPTACRSSRFDFSTQSCVEVPAPNGQNCSDTLACFESAQCVDGMCRGTKVSCDDGDPCTLDVCSEVGCGQVDFTPFCPPSPNRCLVPFCAQDAGCSFQALPDGTACGEQTCTTALICMAGACVGRIPPRQQTCAELLVGVPAGRGLVDGRESEARFSFIGSMAAQGSDLLVLDRALLRHVRQGVVITLAGQRPSPGLIDGAGAQAAVGSATASLAATSQPGLFFLGDGSTIRIASLRGQLTTLAGQADAGGAIDGVGTAARLSVDSVLRPGGAGARFLQLQQVSHAPPRLLVRDVSLTGAVRTLFSLDLGQLGLDGGPTDPSVIPIGVPETGPALTAYFAVRDENTNLVERNYALTVLDGGSQLIEMTHQAQTWWEGQGVRFQRSSSCQIFVSTDAGVRKSTVCSGFISDAYDGDGGVYVAGPISISFIDRFGEQVIAGPVSDRRVVDGTPDGGRLSYARSLSLWDGGIAFVDRTTNREWLRLGRFSHTTPTMTVQLETVDAGRLGDVVSVVTHNGNLIAGDDDGFVFSVNPSTGAQGTSQLVSSGHIARLASNGTELRCASNQVLVLEVDGGVRPIAGIGHAYALAAAPTASWVTFGALDGGDVRSRSIVRIAQDDTITPVAGRPFATTDDDGPAHQAGITEVIDLTVAPDDTVYFLSPDNRLRAVRLGQVVTLMQFSDTVTSLVALRDGTLLVAVDAALYRVVP